MCLIKHISDNCIIIVPNNKNEIIQFLSDQNEIYNIKVYTLNEIKKKILFDYDEKTIYHLMNNYNYSFSHAKDIINSIYYTFFNVDEKKFEKIIKIKKDLIRNNLLKFDNFFVKSIKDKKVIIHGFKHLYKFDHLILECLETNLAFTEKTNTKYDHNALIFKDINQEITFVVNDIAKKIKKGININNIYLANVNDDYINTVKRIFNFHNIPINLNEKKSLFEIESSNNLLNNLNNVDTYLSKIKNSEIFNKCVDILNKYYFVDFKEAYNLIKNDFKNTYIIKPKFKNAINIIDLKESFHNDNDHIYLLGFAKEYIPKVLKDTDYINDNLKPSFLEKTFIKNDIEIEIWKKIIKSIKNLTITFSKYNFKEMLNVSPLIKDYKEINQNISFYSHDSNKFNLAILKDEFFKYGKNDKDLSILNYNYKDCLYLSYNNQFQPMNISFDQISLSYSKLNTYYLCSFRYYLENILYLDKFEQNFEAYLGNLAHEILSLMDEDDFNIENIKNEFLINNEFELTKGNLAYIDQYCVDLAEIIHIIKEKEKETLYKNKEYEKNIRFNEIIEGININFNGYIDKIMTYKNNLVIIDYKSFDPSIDLSNLKDGLNMQLPIYIYLIKKIYPSFNITGIYYQNINRLIPTYNMKKSNKQIKADNLKLRGYTISDIDILKEFDPSYINSDLIHGMKISKKGFYHYTKIFNKDEFNKIEEITKKNIKSAVKKISNAKFEINPKIINKKNISCEYCKFKSICFVNDKNHIYLNQDKKLTFLRSDGNEMD